jgi:oligopeptidase B
MHVSLASRIAVALIAVLLPVPSIAQSAPDAPVAPRKDHVQTWHGKAYADPYYWLREKGTPEVEKYLEAENAYTEAMTAELKPFTDALYAEMLGRIKQSDMSVPTRDGKFYYYSRTVEGLQYPIRCRKPAGANGELDEAASEEVLLDQNEMAKGLKFLSIGVFDVSDDGAKLLYSTDSTGFRQYQLFRKDLATGKVDGPLADRVTNAVWAADNETILFATEDAGTKRSDTIWRLEAGGAPVKVTEEKDALFDLRISRTRDGKFIVASFSATDTWECRLLDASAPKGEFKPVLPREKGHKYDVDHRDGLFYIRTNKGARNFRIVTAPVADASPANWKPFLDHDKDVLVSGIDLFRDFAVVSDKKEGLNRLRIYDFAKKAWRLMSFPEPVYMLWPGGTPEYTSAKYRYSYQSFTTPPSIYDVDMASGDATLQKQQEVLGGYDAARYVSERLWVPARDGVKVPVSVVYRKDVKRDGKAPLLLYGYGSYGYGQSASFDSRRLSLLDRGVVFAIAHVRGGNEMGEAWHDDGMLMKKKNTFFDFVDCADWLVKNTWTSRDRLIIEGGSAGGLLMGAVVNLRPDLFRAVHASVPFVDVMNTMMDPSLPLTVGEYLEWGNPNEKPAFDYMMSYSPYDNLKKGAYPAILVTTSYNDSQVMYWEPAKYVAKLRTLKSDKSELLLKCRMQPAGHGGASGRYDALKDKAFEYAWMLQQVGIAK